MAEQARDSCAARRQSAEASTHVPLSDARDTGWASMRVQAGESAHQSAASALHDAGGHRRAGTGATASSVSRTSFTSVRRLTSRPKTVSTRAGTRHVLERDRLEVIIFAVGLGQECMETCNAHRSAVHRWFGLGLAKAHCVVKLTDVAWGERTLKTPAVLARQEIVWKRPPHFDFLRLEGMVEPMLLSVDLILRERGKASRVGSVKFDLRDDDVGLDEEPHWCQLVTEEGVNFPGMVMLQIVKGKMDIVEIMKIRRRKQMSIMAIVLVFAAGVTVTLLVLLRPHFCDAKCRGNWRPEVSMTVARTDLAATVYDDRIFAAGGHRLNSVESWGAKSRQWGTEVSMTETRGRFGIAVLAGTLVAAGGVGRNTTEAFNGSAFAQYHNSALPMKMADTAVVKFREDSVCLAGRAGGTGLVAPSLGNTFAYSLSLYCTSGLNSPWVYKSSVPTDRLKYAVANFAGRIVVIGGWLHGASGVVEAYDGKKWERLPDLLTRRSAAAAAQMGNRLYVTGGSDGYSTLTSLESFDGEKWRAELDFAVARQQHSAVSYSGRLWIIGGVDVDGRNATALNSVESFALVVEDEAGKGI